MSVTKTKNMVTGRKADNGDKMPIPISGDEVEAIMSSLIPSLPWQLLRGWM